MGVLLKSIRKILVELIDRIDSGECATTDEQERMFLDLCTMIADKERRVSKYEACRHTPLSLLKKARRKTNPSCSFFLLHKQQVYLPVAY